MLLFCELQQARGTVQSANVLQACSVRVKDMKTSKRPPHSAASSPYGDEPCALHVDRAAHDRAGVQATAVAGLKALALRPLPGRPPSSPAFSFEQGPRIPPCRNASAVNS